MVQKTYELPRSLSVNGILVTRNQRDFVKVPRFRFEDWTVS
ncbi:type II toxin-antitoxin system VapC family toxin [Rivularia sp. PCC 7116]